MNYFTSPIKNTRHINPVTITMEPNLKSKSRLNYRIWVTCWAFCSHNLSTGGPPYPRIHYPQYQLSAVGRGPKKIWKIKEIKGS